MPEPVNVLIVANRTAVAERLVEAVQRRAERSPARFHLLVPATPRGLHRVVDPEVTGREEALAQLERALPLLGAAAGSEVTGRVGDPDPVAAIHDALREHPCDELIISTLPRRISRWLHVDLPSKARGFDLPLTHVEAEDRGVPATAAEQHPAVAV